MGDVRITVYIVLFRHLFAKEAHVVLAHPKVGWECEQHWRWIISCIPPHVRECIVGATIDGNSGLRNAIADLCGEPDFPPLIQRCQFHCLAELRRRLGKKAVCRDPATCLCWNMARSLLREPDAKRRSILGKLIVLAIRVPRCSKRTREGMAWFLHIAPEATVLYGKPDLGIPTTTGSAEATCKKLRSILRRIRPMNPKRILAACDMLRRLHPTVTCLPWYAKKSHQVSGS